MKKIITSVLIAVMLMTSCITLVSCQEKKDKHFVVGICEIMEHAALSEATQGFKDALTEELEAEGYTVEFKLQNAQGAADTNNTIISSFVAENVDLILANGTAALAAAYNATETIPILGTSITNYETALGIEGFTGVSGINVSGTSDIAPLTEQADIMIDILGLKTGSKVALLYCKAEENSKYQINIIKNHFESKGIEIYDAGFNDSNDLPSVTAAAAENCDAIYTPTDNTAAANANTIYNIASPKNVPVFVADTGSCKICGFATLSASYYNIGDAAGRMAADILLGRAKIEEIPVGYDATPQKYYNKFICEELGIDTEALEANGFKLLEGTDK